ncbi:MAG: NAD(P)-dependent oxidoreductase [Thermoanaerobaculia bacterium]
MTTGTGMRKVAFLGLGRMGGAMAANLLAAGFDLTVWNRSRERCAPFAERGAQVAATPAAATRGAEAVLYSLADDEAIERVVFGPDGILEGAGPGLLAADLSTVHPDLSRREQAAYAARGAGFLDAPVFGSQPEAQAGGLWIVAGGERAVFDRAQPFLAPLSTSTHYMGETGKGAAMGLIGSLVVGLQLQALGEALVLAQKAGLDVRSVLEILGLPDFRSPIFTGMGGGIVRRDFQPVFSLEHLHKDVDQVARLAAQLLVPIPGSAVVRELVKSAVCQGLGGENASALVKILEQLANLTIGEGASARG